MSCASCVYLAFHLFIRPVSHAFVHFARSLFYLFVRPIFVRSIISLLSLCLFTRLLSLYFCSQYFTVSFILFFKFFFISCHPRVVPFSLGLLTCLFVRHSVAFWFPDPLSPFLTPSPSIFFSSSVLLSSPLFLFAIFSCWTRKGSYHISILQKDVLLKKIFIKLFIRHTSSMALLFVFFYLIFTVGGKKPCIGDHFYIWLKSWLAQTTLTPNPWFNRFAFSHRSSDRNKPGPWERDRLIFFLGCSNDWSFSSSGLQICTLCCKWRCHWHKITEWPRMSRTKLLTYNMRHGPLCSRPQVFLRCHTWPKEAIILRARMSCEGKQNFSQRSVPILCMRVKIWKATRIRISEAT